MVVGEGNVAIPGTSFLERTSNFEVGEEVPFVEGPK